jgi:hypothetical protein
MAVQLAAVSVAASHQVRQSCVMHMHAGSACYDAFMVIMDTANSKAPAASACHSQAKTRGGTTQLGKGVDTPPSYMTSPPRRTGSCV